MNTPSNETGPIAAIANHISKRLQITQDPTLIDVPLVGSPWPTLWIVLIYFATVKIIGPIIMENRKPINPKQGIRFYNLAQIVVNVFLWSLAMRETFLTDNTLTCLRVDRSSALICYCFYLNKLLDLTETYFFLAKKSWRQISYLHVYHHIMVITCVYIDIYLQPGGQILYPIILNTFVHAVMYTYYFLSSWRPDLAILQTLKPLVTQVQLVQFVLGLIVYSGTLLFSNCGNRKNTFLLIIGIIQYAYMMYMFAKFYIQNYRKSREAKKEN